MSESAAVAPRAHAHRRGWLLVLAVAVGFLATYSALQFRPWEDLSSGGAQSNRLTVKSATLVPGIIVLELVNDSEEATSVSQAIVNDSYVDFHAVNASGTLLAIDYPWIEGESYEIELLTPTGASADFEIDDAQAG